MMRDTLSANRENQVFSLTKIPFNQLSDFLGLMKVNTRDSGYKTLFVSSGAICSTKVFIYVKKNRIEGLKEGLYQYDQFTHSLAYLDAITLNEMDSCPLSNHPLENNCHFILFFISDSRMWRKSSSKNYKILSLLDIGYISQVLVENKSPAIGLYSALEVDYKKIRRLLHLNPHEILQLCMLGGVKVTKSKYDYSMIELLKIHKSDIDISEADFDSSACDHPISADYGLGLTDSSDVSDEVIKLHFTAPASLSHYDVKRHFIQTMIPEIRIHWLLATLGFWSGGDLLYSNHHLLAGQCFLYLYIKENMVEDLPAGLYMYDIRDNSIKIVAFGKKELRYAYFPENREVFDKSAFQIFVIADKKKMSTVYNGEYLHYGLIYSGRLGLHLLGRQRSVKIGLCPLGLIDFNLMQKRLDLREDEIILHTIAGGNIL